MGLLHELLAVEPDIKATADSILNETKKVFTNKQDHFTGHTRVYEKRLDDSDDLAKEEKLMVTTVQDKLDHMKKAQSKAIDAIYQKELANTEAAADIEYDGKVIAEKVPATVLLSLENKLKTLQKTYRVIPTLEPGKDWQVDIERANVYRTPQRHTLRTNKKEEHIIVVPPTDRHPAQTAKVVKDVTVGKWNITEYSGMLTPLKKSQMLERLDDLLRAVKKARCRANNQQVENVEIGSKLFDIIHGIS